MKKRISLGFGILCLTVGFILLLNSSASQTRFVPPQPVSTFTPAPIKPQAISGNPRHITISSVDIDLPIIDGYYNAKNKTWTLTGVSAQFATTTEKPNNQAGNTFIYGHNNRKVFSRLPKLKVGDMATVTTDNGHIFSYRYESVKTVNPADSSVLEYAGPPILTLQTCTGFWYQNRSLFTFNFVEVS